MLPHCLGNPQRNHRHFHRPKVLVANPGLCHNRNQSERGRHEIHELHKLAGLVADPYRVYGVGVALSLDCEDAARKTRAPGLRPVYDSVLFFLSPSPPRPISRRITSRFSLHGHCTDCAEQDDGLESGSTSLLCRFPTA
jgi:hypothetical protein